MRSTYPGLAAVAAVLSATVVGWAQAGTRDGEVDCELLVPDASWQFEYTREPNRMRVEIDLPTPIVDVGLAVRCVFANDGSDLHFVLGRRTGICHLPGLALPFATVVDEALGTDGEPIAALPAVRVRAQDSGHEFPPGGATFVADSAGTIPGEQPALVDNTIYCLGLGSPPLSPFAPWGENRCCREYYDMLWEFSTETPISRLAFTTEFSIAGLEGFDLGGLVDEFCGDGVRYCDEECDDGNEADFDGCNARCSEEPCGQPRSGRTDDGRPRSADALHVLFAAVDRAPCDLCVCDVDGSGAINTTDTLTVLRAAVGLDATRECSRCKAGPTIALDRCRSSIWTRPRLGICEEVIGYAPVGDRCLAVEACGACACRAFETQQECEASSAAR